MGDAGSSLAYCPLLKCLELTYLFGGGRVEDAAKLQLHIGQKAQGGLQGTRQNISPGGNRRRKTFCRAIESTHLDGRPDN